MSILTNSTLAKTRVDAVPCEFASIRSISASRNLNPEPLSHPQRFDLSRLQRGTIVGIALYHLELPSEVAVQQPVPGPSLSRPAEMGLDGNRFLGGSTLTGANDRSDTFAFGSVGMGCFHTSLKARGICGGFLHVRCPASMSLWSKAFRIRS
nr:hypothetical protein [Aureimonas sp. D3]